MKQYLYYPGCSLEKTNFSFDHSSREVAKGLGFELKEIEDWNCCGSTSYMAVRELRSFAISARNLAIAERMGKGDLVTVCTACYTVLAKTHNYLKENAELREKVNHALAAADMKYSGNVKVRHLLDVIVNDVGLEAVKGKVKKPLEGLKVACYYGCQLSRPHGTFDDPEFPVTMDHLATALGATPVDFPLKAKCCGGMMMTTVADVGLKLTKDLLYCAKEAGADLVITCCPLCQVNLESYQGKIKKTFGTDPALPAIYFTQLMGVALGLPEKNLGLGSELVDPRPTLAKYLGNGGGR